MVSYEYYGHGVASLVLFGTVFCIFEGPGLGNLCDGLGWILIFTAQVIVRLCSGNCSIQVPTFPELSIV